MWVGGAKRCLINAINPTTHKHAVPALVGLFLGWVRAWDPTWAHCRCEMCDGGVKETIALRARRGQNKEEPYNMS
jgi:hypothetical protein